MDFEGLRKANSIFQDEVVQDYQLLNESVKRQILQHMSSSAFKQRNFTIEKQDNLDQILNILRHEASKNVCQALNTLGFLYFHGIEVHSSESMAFEYFKKSASLKDTEANFICYCLEENIKEKYEYFGKGLLSFDQKIFGTLGYLIDTNKLDNNQIGNKIATYLYKTSARDGAIPVSMSNFAYALEQGDGVTQNYDEAAKYFYKAMKAGYLEARKWLDELYPLVYKFRQQFPDYKPLQSKEYKEYENQKIILF